VIGVSGRWAARDIRLTAHAGQPRPSALVFASGYLINASYFRGIGMLSVPFVRIQYIEAGLTFVAFSFSLASPLLVGMVVKRNLTSMHLPDIAYGIAQVLSVYVFILLPVFYALFMDGSMTFRVCGQDMLIRVFFSLSWLVVAIGVVGAGIVYRKRKETVAPWLAWGIAICALLAAKTVYDRVDWLDDMMGQSLVFVASLFLLCLAGWRVDSARKTQPDKVIRKSYVIIAAVAILVISYSTVIEYSMSVFRYIPVSRGGVKPEFQMNVTVLKEDVPIRQLEGFSVKQEGRFLTIRKVFLIGEDDDHLWLASRFSASSGERAEVLVLKKSDVLFSTLSHADLPCNLSHAGKLKALRHKHQSHMVFMESVA